MQKLHHKHKVGSGQLVEVAINLVSVCTGIAVCSCQALVLLKSYVAVHAVAAGSTATGVTRGVVKCIDNRFLLRTDKASQRTNASIVWVE